MGVNNSTLSKSDIQSKPISTTIANHDELLKEIFEHNTEFRQRTEDIINKIPENNTNYIQAASKAAADEKGDILTEFDYMSKKAMYFESKYVDNTVFILMMTKIIHKELEELKKTLSSKINETMNHNTIELAAKVLAISRASNNTGNINNMHEMLSNVLDDLLKNGKTLVDQTISNGINGVSTALSTQSEEHQRKEAWPVNNQQGGFIRSGSVFYQS